MHVHMRPDSSMQCLPCCDAGARTLVVVLVVVLVLVEWWCSHDGDVQGVYIALHGMA